MPDEEEQSCFAVSDGEESRVKAGHVRVGSGVMSHELCHDLPAGGASTDRGMMWDIEEVQPRTPHCAMTNKRRESSGSRHCGAILEMLVVALKERH